MHSASRLIPAPGGAPAATPGLFIAFEGGDGTGKTTQARLLAAWLRGQGHDVTDTREPGATRLGMRLRALLLDASHAGMSPRAEALMYAADRAEHVSAVIGPALARGAIVVTDRYIDSSLAYQGAGRGLLTGEVARLSRWAADGRMPDLTILLDMPPQAAAGRRTAPPDRLEAEPSQFHQRARDGFLALARAEPSRYLVLDAAQPEAAVALEVRDRLQGLLPDENRRTIGAYEGHVSEYVKGTRQDVSGVMKAWLDESVAGLDRSARILELGSATGRDAAYLRSMGYAVECTDATLAFVRLLQEKGLGARQLNAVTDDLGAPMTSC